MKTPHKDRIKKLKKFLSRYASGTFSILEQGRQKREYEKRTGTKIYA